MTIMIRQKHHSPPSYFTPKKNLTAQRYRFFCNKPTSPEEKHNHWVTRQHAIGKECEFDKMNLEEAIKMVVTLHTHPEKLQRDIIAKDMKFEDMMDAARAIELTSSEMTFIKENLLNPEVNRLSHDTFAGQKDKHKIKKGIITTRKQHSVEVCRYCRHQIPHKGNNCPARGATCNKSHKKNHFAVVCQSKVKPTRL